MTRGNEIRQYLKERNIPIASLEANSIIEGIEWADKHPNSKEANIKLWIARGVNGRLTLHYERPTYIAGKGWDKVWAIPDSSLFPNITFENSPQEVELKVINK